MKTEQDLVSLIGSWVIFIVMAVIGCFANYASKIDSGEKFSLKTLALRLIIAIFAAVLVGLWGDLEGWDRRLTFMACGLAGWMGVSLIKLIENIIKRKAGINEESKTSD